MRCAQLSALTCLLFALSAGTAGAVAVMGGVVSTVASNGACSKSNLIPLDTPQDVFSLSASSACNGESASGTVSASAAKGSAGLILQSSGNGLGRSQVAAETYFSDDWIITPSSADMGNSLITVPVTLTLEGSISPGALYRPIFGNFLQYVLNIYDKSGFATPGHLITANGQISSTGAVALSWSGDLALFHSGSTANPFVATTQMQLLVPALTEGLLDFSNTASISLDLPAGYTARTSSGLPLFVDAPPPAAVPVPAAFGLLLSGLALLSAGAVRERKAL